jgi:hypothetical protein
VIWVANDNRPGDKPGRVRFHAQPLRSIKLEYTVIEHDDLKTLISLVNAAIAEGWRPQGGVGEFKVWGSRMMQAMIRDQSRTSN